ncbi:hypothetical protein J2801_002140 [Paraburkholderia phenoliruptrix]|nr:hypothetical protein [Paraburkholderia phenoliruptrix]
MIRSAAAVAGVIDLATYRRRRARRADCDLSRVDIRILSDGRLEYEANIRPEHSDRMIDALVLMLVRARQAS